VLSPTSHSSSISTSPQHTDSPASPTSVSSSVMSSSGSKNNGLSHNTTNGGQNIMFLSGEQSVSEAVSNISSPDYQDEHDLLSTRDLSAAMAISDPSDSDSTLIVDQINTKEQKISSQMAASEKTLKSYESSNKYTEDEIVNEMFAQLTGSGENRPEARDSSPPISDDGSDAESLHSFHYSPKAVDLPSAERLAKRLYTLDGFKKSDVSRHLSKKYE
jgi:PH and SEC7 domain-containing protein